MNKDKEEFRPTKKRTALVSVELLEKHRYKLSHSAQKLLLGLAQMIHGTYSLFPEVELDIEGVCNYLGFTGKNRVYQVKQTLNEIGSNPLKVKTGYDKKGNPKWLNHYWLSKHGYDGDESRFIKVKFNEDVKGFLLELSQYIKIKGEHVVDLKGQYATWLYPQMKLINRKYYGKKELSIQRLREITFTDKKVSYDKMNNFLTRVVGVSKNQKTNKFEIIENSPLDQINKHTDINVSVLDITKEEKKGKGKTGYKGIVFYVTLKESEKKNIAPSSDKEKYASTIDKSDVPTQIRIPLNQAVKSAKAKGQTIHEFCDELGYKQKGQYIEKMMSEKELEKMRKARNNRDKKKRDKAGHSYRQTTIEETIQRMKNNAKE